jgi:hypothetical protein
MAGMTDSVAVSCSVVVTITDDIVLSDVTSVLKLALVHVSISTRPLALVSSGPRIALMTRGPPVVSTIRNYQEPCPVGVRLLSFQE